MKEKKKKKKKVKKQNSFLMSMKGTLEVLQEHKKINVLRYIC